MKKLIRPRTMAIGLSVLLLLMMLFANTYAATSQSNIQLTITNMGTCAVAVTANGQGPTYLSPPGTGTSSTTFQTSSTATTTYNITTPAPENPFLLCSFQIAPSHNGATTLTFSSGNGACRYTGTSTGYNVITEGGSCMNGPSGQL